uniref:Retrovirus-related Pol polyprotein from transposon TNT 1-94 n=1 Tax=Tanacetum cinerariifolium TaxID=118510 RepID=A0A699JKU5_TANCI|nr:hypothetical protein [Tanacetum cinerariifolium]
MITQPTDVPLGNNNEVSRTITEPLVLDVTQSHIPNQASTSSHPAPQDRCSRDQHIERVNIIGNPREGMLTKSMVAKLTAASASECLFADFLFEIEPKKVSEALKNPGWIDAMQEELNQFDRNKDNKGISICQEQYTRNLLNKYDIFDSSSVKTPMVPPNNLDSNYAGCNMDRKSISGTYQILGGKLVCWSAKKQHSMVMSSAEAEYVGTAGCCAILHSRTKHIDIRYHFIKDHILKGEIKLHFIPTKYQVADIFTKPLDELAFTRLKAKLGMLIIDESVSMIRDV